MTAGHTVIKIEGRWAVRTVWTKDYQQTNNIVRSIPGARFDPQNKVWYFDPKGHELEVIPILQKLGISVPQEILQVATEKATQMDLGAQDADERSLDPRLYGYQVEGVRTLARMDRWLLSDDMGLGKTVQALLALPEDAPVFCVVPANVKGNWKNEINLWRPGTFKVEILSGRKSFRFPQPGEILICNWEILPSECDWVNSSAKAPNGISEEFEALVPQGLVVIGDEIHRAKNTKARRTRRYMTLNHLAVKHGGKCWGLTGTPMLNRPPELWTVLDTLGLAEKAFGNFGRFYRLFNAYSNGYGTTWGMPTSEVPGLLAKVSLRRMKSEVLPDLPGKRWQNIEVELASKETKKSLDQFQEDMDSGVIRVLSNGLPSFEEMSEQRASLAAAKIPALLELVESYEEEETPVVVFSAHKAPVEALAGREGWATITGATSPQKRTEIVQGFQDGNYKGIAITIKAGCEGITLTHASN
ncbi:MAG: SNF2-related protein, partial [Dehalococcoidia bacterium]|nr:SNF2-related protein [Dehalococcoidia bacterium]